MRLWGNFIFIEGKIIMNFKLKPALLTVILGLFLLAGCSKSYRESQSATTDSNHPMDMLRQDVGSEPPTMDPVLSEDTYSRRVMNDLFAGLLDFDQQNNPIPGLASSWEISTDGKTYTFHLRKDIKFSDGSPITAKDFIYSWRRLVDPKTASPYNMLLANVVGANQIITGKSQASTLGVSASNNETFVVKLVHPDAYFLKAILMPNTTVVSQKNIEKYGKSWIDPDKMVTSGPYMLKEHIINGYVLAEKNPYYFDAKNVSIPKVKYLPYEDNNATIPSYKAGGVDVTFQSLPVDQYAELQQAYGKQLHTVLQEGNYYLDFNMQDPQLTNNLKLRQALSMAVDRDALINQVLKQGQKPLYSVVTPTVDNGAYASIVYDWATWPRPKQVEQAKKLFAEAGYGANHPLIITYSFNTNDLHKRVALAVTAMWKQVFGNGIQASIQNQDWKTFLQIRHKGSYQIARDGWVADYNGVTSYTNLYSCGNDQNNSHYCNKNYNNLMAQSMAELNPVKQTELIKQALQLPLNDYAVIPLFQYSYQQLIKPYVKGYNPDNNFLENFQSKWMTLEK